MAEEIIDSDQELRLKLYAETRSDLLKRQLSNSENADRAILSVSTAALGFSLAFLKDIVPLQDAVFSFLPYLSWTLFVLSIVVTLLSFFTSQKAVDQQLELAHRYYIERDESAAQIRPKSALVTDTLNKSGAVLLVVGLLAICIFVGTNLWKGKIMADKKITFDGAPTPSLQRLQTSEVIMEKGATIPSLQTVPAKPLGGAPVPGLQQVPSPPAPAPTVNSKNK